MKIRASLQRKFGVFAPDFKKKNIHFTKTCVRKSHRKLKDFFGNPIFFNLFFVKCKTEIKCSDWNAHIFLLFLITLTPSSYTVAPAVNEPSIMFYWLSFNKASIYCLIKKHRCTTGVQTLVWARSHKIWSFKEIIFKHYSTLTYSTPQLAEQDEII